MVVFLTSAYHMAQRWLPWDWKQVVPTWMLPFYGLFKSLSISWLYKLWPFPCAKGLAKSFCFREDMHDLYLLL